MDDYPFVVEMGDSEKVYVSKDELNAFVFQQVYWWQLYPYLPLMMEHLMERDQEPFRGLVDRLKAESELNNNWPGLSTYVLDYKHIINQCSQAYDSGFVAYPDYILNESYLSFLLQDQRFGVDSAECDPVHSDVPALILVGEYDPITPPLLSRVMRDRFKNHYYLQFPRIGHAVISTPCGQEVAVQFINNPGMRPLTDCLEQLGENKITFVTSYYKNSRFSSFVLGIYQNFNILLLAGLLLVIVMSILNLTYEIRTGNSVVDLKRNLTLLLLSIFSLAFLILLAYFIVITTLRESFLILFGLSKGANIIFYLSPLIQLLTVIIIVQTVIKKEFQVRIVISLITFASLCGMIIYYHMWPNI